MAVKGSELVNGYLLVISRLCFIALAMQIPVRLIAQTVPSEEASDFIRRARAAAQTNQNASSAELFKLALQVNPGMRMVLLREYADQLTYSNRAAEAVPLYAEVLAKANLGEEEEKQARRGYALALSWSGQHNAAINQYNGLISSNPEDRNARLDRAKVRGWARQYSLAERDYRYLLDRNSDDRDARHGLADIQSLMGHPRAALETLSSVANSSDPRTIFLLARAQQWSGRNDFAAVTLAHSLNLKNSEIARIGLEISKSRAPLLVLSARTSEQSDQTTIREVAARQSLIGPGALELIGVQVSRERFHQRGGDTLTVTRPGAHARIRLSEVITLSAEGAIAIQMGLAGKKHYPLVNVYGTFLPSDVLRIDIGASRTTFDSIRALQRRIDVTEYGGSVDLGSDASWKVSARANYQVLSDGNERFWAQSEVRRRFSWSPNLFLGLRGTAFRYDKVLDNGYYNPRSLYAVEMTTQAWGRIGPGYFDLRVSAGREDANPGGKKMIYSGEARITQPLTSRIEGEVFVSRFSSRFNTNSGFARTSVGANLKVRW